MCLSQPLTLPLDEKFSLLKLLKVLGSLISVHILQSLLSVLLKGFLILDLFLHQMLLELLVRYFKLISLLSSLDL